MTFYVLYEKDEELGFVPIDFLGYNPKGKKPTYLFPQERINKDRTKTHLARIERDFAGLESTKKSISVNSNSLQKNLEGKIIFD